MPDRLFKEKKKEKKNIHWTIKLLFTVLDVLLSFTIIFYLCFPYQVCLTFGALILFAGLIVILVGYTTPARIEAFGEDDLLFVDR